MRWIPLTLLAAVAASAGPVTLAETARPAAPAPTILYTDIVSGPNAGGEGGNGIYLSIFGRHFGRDQGRSTRVYINKVEVASYRYLGPSRGRLDVDQLTVQIGALGHPSPGKPLPIEVVVDGRASNADHSFTVNPGRIYFVSLSGSDESGDGSFDKPYRTVQRGGVNNNGAASCPAALGNQSLAAAGVWGLVQPGDFIVMRGGAWTDVARDGYFLRVQNKAGLPPTGSAGTGPITLMGYPGEKVSIERANLQDDQWGGGIASADNARQRLGCGSWITISNVSVESGFNEGMINVQNGAANPSGSHWRVVNNEMSAVSCRNNTRCRAGGVAGAAEGGFWVGNYVHDVHDRPDALTSLENHGFYVEGPGTYEIAYNRIESVVGGNGIQAYSSSRTITNVRIHHNLIRGVGKHGINIANGSATGILVFDNVIVGADMAGIRLGSSTLTGAKIFNNTVVDTDRLRAGGPRAALMNDERLPDGAVEMRNNLVVPGSGRNYVGGSAGFASLVRTISHNLWFDGSGRVPGQGNVFADPRFAGAQFELQAGSPAIDAGYAAAAAVATTGFDGVVRRPQGGGVDIGAYEHSH